MFRGQVILQRQRRASSARTNDRNNQADQIPRSHPVLTSVEVHACTGVSEVRDRPVGQIYAACIGGGGVCRLMDNGVRARDWLQCPSIGLCVPARITTRNIISTDWHFALASINIAPRRLRLSFALRRQRGISNFPNRLPRLPINRRWLLASVYGWQICRVA